MRDALDRMKKDVQAQMKAAAAEWLVKFQEQVTKVR